MIYRWNTDKILNDIHLMGLYATDPRATGFETWPIKQDLYKIKWAVEEALAKCPPIADEDKFLEEHEKEVMMKVLKS
jgi:hypothetical protein